MLRPRWGPYEISKTHVFDGELCSGDGFENKALIRFINCFESKNRSHRWAIKTNFFLQDKQTRRNWPESPAPHIRPINFCTLATFNPLPYRSSGRHTGGPRSYFRPRQFTYSFMSVNCVNNRKFNNIPERTHRLPALIDSVLACDVLNCRSVIYRLSCELKYLPLFFAPSPTFFRQINIIYLAYTKAVHLPGTGQPQN